MRYRPPTAAIVLIIIGLTLIVMAALSGAAPIHEGPRLKAYVAPEPKPHRIEAPDIQNIITCSVVFMIAANTDGSYDHDGIPRHAVTATDWAATALFFVPIFEMKAPDFLSESVAMGQATARTAYQVMSLRAMVDYGTDICREYEPIRDEIAPFVRESMAS